MNHIPLLTQSVQTAAHALLKHFQAQYGAMIFIPLGVGDSTPQKIAPAIAQQIQTSLLLEQNNNLYLLATDERVGQVFDTFLNTFIDSLNFIAKGVLSALGMKMYRADFAQKLQEKKTSEPETYQKWKTNLTLVLESVFTQIILDLQQQGIAITLTDGTKTFTSVKEMLESLPTLQ
ncbi:MAG: hypothetical protein Q4B28_00470 [bacterium]|nr:hypothetical protein [bacterium]